VSADPRVHVIEVASGHGAIVGENGIPPMRLLEVLEGHGVLAATPEERAPEIAALLDRLYTRL